MIRVLFIAIVAGVGFVAAALWVVRSGGAPVEIAAVVPEPVATAVATEAARLGEEVAASLVASLIAPSVPLSVKENAGRDSEARAGDASGTGANVAPAPQPGEPISGAPSVSRAAPPEDPIEVVDVSPPAAFARDDGPTAGESEAQELDPAMDAWAETEVSREDAPPAAENLDGSAHLIRRMLTVYRAAGPRR